MNDISYIAIPRTITRPVRIDSILETRMRVFLLARRQKIWLTEGR